MFANRETYMFDIISNNILNYLVQFSLLLLGIAVLAIIIMYIIDVTQTAHTIRRNYPVIGRFRYFFEHLGEFFRQYFFAMDREELPFNRSERSWVYRAAKNVDRTIAFGSTRNLTPSGSIYFLNSAFPTLDEDAVDPTQVTIGPNSRHPYCTSSIINISAMSYGAISAPAVKALSLGAKKAGCWMNTGEGGLSCFHLQGGADLVFQIGTAKYGVRDENGNLSDEKLKKIASHEQVKMFEIKLSQGAKPGKGGILPANKVSAEIAEIRSIPEGQASISPNGHLDIKKPEDLLNMVHHIREITGKPVGFKFVLGEQTWFEELLQLMLVKGQAYYPDFITLDSADGGTGAAPQSLMDFVGMPLKESLPWVIDQLIKSDLKQHIKVIASGKLITPSSVAWALAIGADFVNSARGFMFALGCIQAMQCNKNTCPTGITTHNKKLQRGLVPANKAERIAHYHQGIHYDVGVIAHSCGVSNPRELRRKHVRIITDNGMSIPLDQMHPVPIKIIETINP
jgi:glutamate synthase domain-containing protein 2